MLFIFFVNHLVPVRLRIIESTPLQTVLCVLMMLKCEFMQSRNVFMYATSWHDYARKMHASALSCQALPLVSTQVLAASNIVAFTQSHV